MCTRPITMANKPARTTKSVIPAKKPGLTRQSSIDLTAKMMVKKIQISKPNVPKSTQTKTTAIRPTQPKENKAENTTLEQEMKEAEAKFQKLLEGDLKDLPSLPPSTVRIFVSSTFSDMRAERNAMVRDVIPLLKDHCAKYDLDFQLVDMRWGVTEDSQNDHSVEKICLLEVENCQKISLGPNFILISGDRYGFRPIPTEIDMDEFDVIKRFATELPDAKILDVWYLLDENAKPPQYILQPIRSQFTFYGDYSAGCEEPRAKDTLGWETAFKSLQTTLRQAVTQAFKAKQLPEDKIHKYFHSVTEIEVNKGILTAHMPEIHTSVYHRKLSHGDNIEDNTAKRYFDTTIKNGKLVLDEDVKLLREKLIKEKISTVMSQSGRIHVYTPNWYEGGIDPEKHKDHTEYIRQLCFDLVKDITDLIDKGRKEQKGLVRTSEYYADYHEVLHHLHFCKLKCETFCGREDVLEKTRNYILNDKSRKPLIIYAPSGAGKTSIMAKIMQQLPEWFRNQSHVGILRFLGTSPQSIDIYHVLYSMCGQLADCAEILMEPVGYKTMKNMLNYMPRFLRRVSSKLKKPVVILLDSLDQILPNNDAYLCNWLPTILPGNVRLIVSTLPEEHEILDTLKKIFPDTSNFVEVPALPDEAGFEMIDKYLEKKNRIVTQLQTKQVVNAFRKCRGPLYLKLILDEAITWNSYTPDHALVLQDTVQGAINQLFDNMEKKFGQILISHALGYITVAFNGISDIEWEDVLSCDDEVLNDIYRYHDPPVPGIVRMPPVLVARIRYDLREYIVERRSFGKTTLNWYHRQFIETAHKRYVFGNAGKMLHRILAEYFIANDGIKRDITLQRRKLKVENADRQVTKQPLTVKNRRKLTAAPYHITQAGDNIDPSQAKADCFCNLDFLRVRLAALPLSSWIEDLTKYLDKTEDEEVAFLKNYFQVINTDAGSGNSLAINLLSRLNVDDSQPYLKQLMQQAKDLVQSSKTPLLIPVFPCLAPRTDASSALAHIYNDIGSIMAESLETVLMTNVQEEEMDDCQYSVYDAINNEMYRIVPSKDFKPTLPPLLDQSEKRIIQIGKDRFQTFHFHNQTFNQKKLTEICKEIDVKSYPLMSTLSTDSLHLTILFNNGDVLTFDTNGFKEVDMLTLSEEPCDVANIITTSIDNLKIILTINSDNNQKGNQNSGCVRIHTVGTDENGKLLKIAHPLNEGFAAVGCNETLLVGCCNKETGGNITVIDVENVRVTITEDCSKVIQLSVSHAHALAAMWLEQGFVAVYNISNGDIVQELHINNTLTSVGVSWIHDLVFIGDNKGQIILYKAQTGKHLGNFNADSNEIVKISVLEDQVLTLSKKHTLRIWQISRLINSEGDSSINGNAPADCSDLLSQKDILGFDLDINGNHIITASEDKNLRVWSVFDANLVKKLYIGMNGNKVLATMGTLCTVLDIVTKNLKVMDFIEGVEKMSFRNVVDFCIAQDYKTLYLVKTNEKSHHVEIVDIGLLKTKKSFLINQPLTYESLNISLNESERYLILQVKITEKERVEIQASVKKQGSGLLQQHHPHRFYGIDLTQAAGGLMPCNRMLTKIPHLGEVICPYKGNVMMITLKRSVLFWDLPTGKCDQRVTKEKNLSFMSFYDHINDCYRGTILAMDQSKNGLYIAVGSEDGYMIVWDAITGFPFGKKEPQKIHTASVVNVAISPDSSWVVSYCLNNMLKLWQISTGTEVFSLKIPSDLLQMKFTVDSKHLVINTGIQNTRMLVYRLHTGQP